MLGLLLATLTVSTSFAGGSVGRVDLISPNHLRCAVRGQTDQNGRNRQASWYYFRIDNLPRTELRIDLTDLVGEYNLHPGTHPVSRHTQPVFSYDNRSWKHFTEDQLTWNDQEKQLTVHFRPRGSTIWIAHMAPYTNNDLTHLLDRASPYLKTEIIGMSVHGRPIRLLTVTDSSTSPKNSKRVIWLVARQHAWEAGTSWVVDGAIRFLLSEDTKASQLRRFNIFKILPMFDPDGVADGAVRFNANGYDNNRNWGNVDPARMPEIAATRGAIMKWLDAGRRIDLFVALHNTEEDDYVEAPIAAGGQNIRMVVTSLVKCLRIQTSFHDPSSPRDNLDSAPVPRDQMDLAQALFIERKVPAFLMELMINRHPSLRRPRTIEDYESFGTGLVTCLATADRTR